MKDGAVSVVQAARTLRLDLELTRLVPALQAASVPVLLIKGPAAAFHLYADAPWARAYSDIDVVVPTDRLQAAGSVLDRLGYESQECGLAPGRWASPGQAWRLRSEESISVDLHHGFHGVIQRAALFDALWGERAALTVGDLPVPIPGPAGCCLLATLHAWREGDARTREDLARATTRLDDEAWRAAARLADRVDATDAFRVGIRLVPSGAALAQRLAIPTAASPTAWLETMDAGSPGSRRAARRMLGATELSWRERLGFGARVVFPSAPYMRWYLSRLARLRQLGLPSAPLQDASEASPRWPEGGLVGGYALRLVRVCREGPPATLDWHRARRLALSSGWRPPAPPLAVGRRSLRAGASALIHADLLWWAARCRRIVRRQLATRNLYDIELPSPPAASNASTSRGDAVVHAVLRRSAATCLETTLIRQRWLASRGIDRDLVIGIRGDDRARPPVSAHAWLDGSPEAEQYLELLRRPAS